MAAADKVGAADAPCQSREAGGSGGSRPEATAGVCVATANWLVTGFNVSLIDCSFVKEQKKNLLLVSTSVHIDNILVVATNPVGGGKKREAEEPSHQLARNMIYENKTVLKH